jgi:hypothetical protein
MSIRQEKTLPQHMQNMLKALDGLCRGLRRCVPMAEALSKHPGISEYMETDPIDHDAAKIYASAVKLRLLLVTFLEEYYTR